MSDLTPTHAPANAGRRGSLFTWLAVGALAAVASAAGNLAVFAIARAADASLVVVDGGEVHEVEASGVAGASVVPMLAGIALVALVVGIAPRRLGVVRLAQVVGGGFALLSVVGPLTIDTDGGTAAALAVMHVVTGATLVIGLEGARRRVVAARRTPGANPVETTGDASPVAA
jgi:hypothetical protein